MARVLRVNESLLAPKFPDSIWYKVDNTPVSSSFPGSWGRAVRVKSCFSNAGSEREEGQAVIGTPSHSSFCRFREREGGGAVI